MIRYLLLALGGVAMTQPASAQQNTYDLQITQSASVNIAQVAQNVTLNYDLTLVPVPASPPATISVSITITGDVEVSDSSGRCTITLQQQTHSAVCSDTYSADLEFDLQLEPNSVGQIVSKARETGELSDLQESESVVTVVATNHILSQDSQLISFGNVSHVSLQDIDEQNGADLMVMGSQGGRVYLNNGAGVFAAAPNNGYLFTSAVSNATGLISGYIQPVTNTLDFIFSTDSSDNFPAFQLDTTSQSRNVMFQGETLTVPANTPILEGIVSLIALAEDLDTQNMLLVDFATESLVSDTATDLVIANAGSGASGIYLNQNGIYLTLFRDTDVLSTRDTRKILADDFNNDQRLDVALANYNYQNQLHLAANGNLPWIDLTRFSQETLFGASNGLTVDMVKGHFGGTLDSNNLPLMDLVVVNEQASSDTAEKTYRIELLENQGNGAFAAPQLIALSNQVTSIETVRLNSDALDDLIIHNYDGSIFLYENSASGFQMKPFAISVDENSQVVTGDFDSDGVLDLAAASRAGGGIKVFLAPSSNSFSLSTYSVSGAGGIWIALFALIGVVVVRVWLSQRK